MSEEFKHELGYKKMLKESYKGYFLEMQGRAKRWVPKSQCSIDLEEKIIHYTDWLHERMMEETHEKYKLKEARLKKKMGVMV